MLSMTIVVAVVVVLVMATMTVVDDALAVSAGVLVCDPTNLARLEKE